MHSLKEKLILSLHKIGAVKFGSFKLKSGLTSPFYIDLRPIISYPDIVENINSLLKELVQKLEYELITGIPYTALPIAANLAASVHKPLIYQRKEPKAYGTANAMEGNFNMGDRCVVIDDVMTTGESKIEIADVLENAQIKVKDFIIIVDRSFDGSAFLAQRGYKLHSVISIYDIVETLFAKSLLSIDEKEAVVQFMKNGEAQNSVKTFNRMAQTVKNKQTKLFLETALKKKSNLIISLDVDSQQAFFNILEKVADQIVMVKTHVDILKDFDTQFAPRLLAFAKKKNFLIFEDRKFADIGSTVQKQFFDGVYKIADWAQFITVHAVPGEGIVQGLFTTKQVACSGFLLAAMSAKGNLINEGYTRTTIAMGAKYPQHISGFIGFGKTEEDLKKLKAKIPQDMLLLMPGVNLDSKGDGLGQQYVSVKQAVQGGADAIIVGRGIIAAADPQKEAKRYRDEAWNALQSSGRID